MSLEKLSNLFSLFSRGVEVLHMKIYHSSYANPKYEYKDTAIWTKQAMV